MGRTLYLYVSDSFFFPFGFESPVGNKQTPGTETYLFCPMFSVGFDLTGHSQAKRFLLLPLAPGNSDKSPLLGKEP